MRLTIEPTDQRQCFSADAKCPKITIEHPDDYLDLRQVWHLLLRPALLAYGFQPGSVDRLEKEDQLD